MRAIVCKRPNEVSVETVADPKIESPTDAIVRITSAGICGSDLHMYEGRTPASGDMRLGHENMGVVEEVGDAVNSIRTGDRVVMPFNIACGSCFNCARGFTNACLVVNPEGVSGGYGYAGMGPYPGGQAEYLRVPYADFNCLKLPGEPGDELEDDFLLLSDVFPTGYHGAVLANVQPGSTVAVFGAGPVGLMAAYSSLLRGASIVYVVDSIPERLAKAQQIGAIPINFAEGDPVEQIKKHRKENALIAGSLRPGEEKMEGVMCGIDAVGYQARDGAKADEYSGPESPTQVMEWLSQIINPTGHLGIVGVYFDSDPGAADKRKKKGIFELPWGTLFNKAFSIGTGQCPVKRYNVFLRDLIISGRARPSFIVSHHSTLDDAPDAYEKFDARQDGYTKVILKPLEEESVPAE